MLKNFLKLTLMISAYFTLAHSPDLKAQSVQNPLSALDTVIFVPAQKWSAELKPKLEKASFDFSQALDQYQYVSDDASIRFVSDRVDFHSKVSTSAVQGNDAGAFNLSLQLNSASVRVNNFNLDVTTQKDLGFGLATLHLKVRCDAIQLDLQNTSTIAAQLRLINGSFSLAELEWSLAQTTIQTQMIGCTDIPGFDGMLKQQVQQMIEQKFVVETLKNLINGQLNGVIYNFINKEMLSYLQTLGGVSLQPDFKFDDENNLWLSSKADSLQTFSAAEIQKIKESKAVSLLIKKAALENLAKELINLKLTQNTISSKNLKALDRLTCSRFLQFFVWPSLKSLNKCFEMKIQSRVQDFVIHDIQTMSVSVKVNSWASGEGHNIAFFESSLSGKLLNTQLSLNGFKGIADADFINWSGRSKRISTSMVQPSLQDLIDSSLADLKKNSVLSFIQSKASFKLISAETLLIELKN